MLNDLLENADLRRGFYADQGLSVDEFADRHQRPIREFAQRAGYPISADEAYQTAADLWRKLRDGE